MKNRAQLNRILHRALWLAIGWAMGLGVVNAQRSGILKRGDEAYETMAYLEAIKLYEKALKKGFDKTALLRLADSYRLTNNPRKAAEVYSKVVSLNQIPPLNYFYFAQSLMNLGMYPEAAKWFDKYAKTVPTDPRGASFAASCRAIEGYFADTAEVRIRPFPHNTSVDEFSPIWFKDGILFSSSRAEGAVVESRYEWNGQPFLDLYYSKMEGEGSKFSRPTSVKGKLNTRFHEAVCAWDSVHQLAYFTRNNYFEGKKVADEKGILNLKLFYADVPASGPWTNVRSMPFNSDQYSVGHPAVMKGGKTLLFISDMPGGLGGTDLYRVDFDGDNGWSPPVNLGPKINSPGNEMFPYITPDGLLYFSSDGLGGLGGLDVFVCDLRAQECKPQNLGAPINGSSDDFGFLIAYDGTWGMFSSNRGGGKGSDDIYIFDYQKPLWNAVVLDAVTKMPIPNAKLTLALPRIDKQLTTTSDANGVANLLVQRNVTYQAMVEASQYRVERLEVSTYGAKAGDILRDTVLLTRPSVIVVTKVLDVTSGYPIVNATVRLVDSDLTLRTDSAGEVTFYYDPYPEYQQRPVDCPPAPEGEYCFRFMDEAVMDTDTLKLTYEWSFGDGTKVREEEPRHCYSKPGTYHVELNLLDASGQVFMNQTSYELEVRPPAGLSINGPDTVDVGSVVSFVPGENPIEGCTVTSYQWELSDGRNFTGPTLSTQFGKPGTYKLKLSVGGNELGSPKACGGCVSKEVVCVNPRLLKKQQDSLAVAWSEKPTPIPAKIDCKRQEPEDYCYSFTDEGGLSTDSLPFIYLWDLGDGTRMTGVQVNHCYAAPGLYPVRLEVLDPLSKQLVSVLSEYALEVRDLRQVYIASYDTVSMGKEFELDARKSDAPGCAVKSVYWQMGDGATLTGAVVRHAYTRRGTFRVEMVLQGTDSATGEPCMRCTYKEVHVVPDYHGNEQRDSLREASTVADIGRLMPDGTILLEIVKEGFGPRRLSIHPGTEPGTVRDSVYLVRPSSEASVTVEVNDHNSRMKLKDAEISLRDPQTGLELGKFRMEEGVMTLPLEPNRSYTLIASKEGYLSDKIDLGPIKKGKDPLRVSLELHAAVVGSSWILHNIYYDFDKYFIRHDAAIELEKLKGFLEANPGLTVELSSHTDVRGSDEYNLVLAQNRAESAVRYLVERGIASNRIVAHGYGEQRLHNRCDDGVPCSEELHQENRRTEITILGLTNPLYSQARRVEDIWGAETMFTPSTPDFSGPFTILVGTYTREKASTHFDPLKGRFSVNGKNVDGFWEYTTGDYPNFERAASDLPEVVSRGYPHASILARPSYTLPAVASAEPKPEKAVAAAPAAAPEAHSTDVFYSVQIAVVGRTVQDVFLEDLGEYQEGLFEKQISGRRVFFVGQYRTELEALKHLARIRKKGHSDAFLVHFDRGKKVNLDKIGSK
ncbi:MAG: PKD domain-containing protein [Bacteroidia bacterium]